MMFFMCFLISTKRPFSRVLTQNPNFLKFESISGMLGVMQMNHQSPKKAVAMGQNLSSAPSLGMTKHSDCSLTFWDILGIATGYVA